MSARVFRRAAAAALIGASVLAGPSPAAAQPQDYPNRSITLVVPFPPGGSTSIVGRLVADKMSEILGQQIVVDNRGGAGGTVAARAFTRATPDGYTLLFGYSGTIAIGPSLYPAAGFDPRKDFAPVGMIGTAPAVLVVHPGFDVASAGALVALARDRPGQLAYGSAGVGTVTHIAGELFVAMSGAKLTHIPYRGSGPVLNDLVGGHIKMSFTPIPAVRAMVQNGSLKALAVTSAQRSALMPSVPTVSETGLPGYEVVLRYGLLAPAGTPRPIVETLNKALREALAAPDLQQRLAHEGAEVLASTPEEYAADIDREETKWSKVIREAGIKAE
ncbi:tripartite tricarboxylate transporter substrate binding protein [Rhodoplanes sp. TEM]|uniref:Tripartite tricarboxylate transporter substrate binding protein n=1 Tax=Rhodoplanes tepidamans TaxID=200616 RepID=A0ABT5JDZ9_RHOTP|nr:MULTISPECIES: tripartite tricarboxylate transporter substrate binding protein [Rhodoplanes]MDC7787683.1 tripartite tricarboxylate transporter substrate binding protein [Rhodoplanes tepidamans]MDC7983057.1 tripartite tricarboxylate transporter substrate binding protein [Rhodoplanes sp. TEM]MDQ0356439.1 tripartite-type tricarboxylate transporter receptor subunit TctC [Rhodoplanes tepidamans]